MNDRYRHLDFDPRFEHIDKRDIRNAFALPRFDEHSKMREHNKPFSTGFPEWSLFRPEPMTHQIFTTEDLDSDGSSVSSGGSTGSSHGQPLRITRGSRVHHIPILVEGRDDSSGYSSDTRSDESKQTVNNKASEPRLPKPVPSTSQPSNRSRPQAQGSQGSQAQRSMSNQEFAPTPRPEAHPKKSASQPPSSPPPQPTVNGAQQPGPFVTQVRVNMPVTVETKQAQQSQERKPEKSKPDPTKQINDILDEMKLLKAEVEKFPGNTKDKQYRYLDEMLTRLMLKLDDVNTEGQDGIRQHRKQAVKEIQSCISLLEQRISDNEEKRMQGNQEPVESSANGEDNSKAM